MSVPPHATKSVTLHVTPKAEGVLTIRGVAWLLQGVAKGYMLLDASRHNRRIVRAAKGKSTAACVVMVSLLCGGVFVGWCPCVAIWPYRYQYSNGR